MPKLVHTEAFKAAQGVFADLPNYHLALKMGTKHRLIEVTTPSGGVHRLTIEHGDTHKVADWARQKARRLRRQLEA